MNDLVNDYFKRFYPDDLDREAFAFSTLLGGMNEYKKRDLSTIFPQMECVDGFTMSVQGHFGAYSKPRDDFADHYSKVEVGFPSAREDLLLPYMDGGPDTDPTQTVYGYVPISVIEQIVAKHGGLKP